MKSKEILLTLIGCCLVGGGIWFLATRNAKKGARKSVPVRAEKEMAADFNLSQSLSFHPTQVTHYSWVDLGKAKHGVEWPLNNQSHTEGFRQLIQNRLDLLARIHQLEVPQKGEASNELSFTLSFRDGGSWTGAMAQDWIYWTSGPFKNKGVKLSSDQKFLISSELVVPTDSKVNLCVHRVIRIGLLAKKIDFSFKNYQWQDAGQNKTYRVGSLGNQIENWLSEYCSVAIDGLYSLDMVAGAQTTEQIQIEDQEKQTLFIKVYNGAVPNRPIFTIENNGKQKLFTSNQLSKALEAIYQIAEVK